MNRVWIYQSNRFFSSSEVEVIRNILDGFVEQWTAHGNQLAGSFEVLHNLFIILKVDESKAMVTGCSIDKSVHLLKRIEAELSVDLFDRLCVAYRETENSEEIKLASRIEFELLVSKGDVNENTIVFNNMVSTQLELETIWESPLKDSWHGKVFL